MKTSIKKLAKSEIEIFFEIPTEEFKDYFRKTLLNLGKDIEIEGFRKGKAPAEITERELGIGKILEEAANLAVRENYIKVITENKIEAISSPKIEILKLTPGNPLVFRAKIWVLPEIELPDYKKIASKIEKRKIQVLEEEIKEVLIWLQKSRPKFILKNQPAQKCDFVEIDFQSPQIENSLKREDGFILGQSQLIPSFEENLEGMRDGEEKEFSLRFPENYFQKNLAGQKINFKVKMKSVQAVEFPEIDDQFAQNLGKFENLDSLKKSIRDGISLEKEIQESQRVRQEILEKIAQATSFEVPEILIESEKNKMLGDLKRRTAQDLQISFENYLERIKKSEQDLRDSFSPLAEKIVRNSLILREISKRENIRVLAEEIKAEMNKILRHYPDIEKAKKSLDLEKLKDYTEEAIRNEKTLQLLENLVKKYESNSNRN